MKHLHLISTNAIIAAAFMSDVLPTVYVKGENGPMRINEADYDKAKHGKILDNEDMPVEGITQNTVMNAPPGMSVPPAPSTPPELLGDQPPQTLQLMPGNPPVPSPAGSTIPQTQTVGNDQRLVAKQGKKFYVVNIAGDKIDAEGIDKDGYASEQEAWKAATPALAGHPAPTSDNPA